jgi:Tfp pilus assembly protein PilZ
MFGHFSTKEKRAELRFPVVLPLSYLELGSAGASDGQTHDISQGGLCLATDREIPLGAQIEIILKMIDSDELIHEKGMVVWSARYSDDTHRVGIKLQEPKLKPVPLVLKTIMALAQRHREKKPA